MDNVLGLLGMLIFIPTVIFLAAFITWAVVKITPAGKKREVPEPAKP